MTERKPYANIRAIRVAKRIRPSRVSTLSGRRGIRRSRWAVIGWSRVLRSSACAPVGRAEDDLSAYRSVKVERRVNATKVAQ